MHVCKSIVCIFVHGLVHLRAHLHECACLRMCACARACGCAYARVRMDTIHSLLDTFTHVPQHSHASPNRCESVQTLRYRRHVYAYVHVYVYMQYAYLCVEKEVEGERERERAPRVWVWGLQPRVWMHLRFLLGLILEGGSRCCSGFWLKYV